MKRKIYSLLVLALVLGACAGGSGKKGVEKAFDATTSQFTNGITEISEDVLNRIKFSGQLVHAVGWNDKNGDNVLLLTESNVEREIEEGWGVTDVELKASHYVNKMGSFELLTEVDDFERDCDFDNRARFMEEAVTITDLDNNGVAEITIVYRLGCSSELSPDGLKLVLIENGEMYYIHGYTKIDQGPDFQMGGETNIGDEFKNAPEAFLNHAKEIWNYHQDHILYLRPRAYVLENLSKYHDMLFFGTEPFWSLRLHYDYAVFTSPEEEGIHFNYDEVSQRYDGSFYIAASVPGDEKLAISVSFHAQECSDYMTDDIHPYTISGYVMERDYSGCGRY